MKKKEKKCKLIHLPQIQKIRLRIPNSPGMNINTLENLKWQTRVPIFHSQRHCCNDECMWMWVTYLNPQSRRRKLNWTRRLQIGNWWPYSRAGSMTSSLAGTVAHGARGGRGVSTSHFCRIFPGLSGTPRYSPELPGSGSHNTCIIHWFYQTMEHM